MKKANKINKYTYLHIISKQKLRKACWMMLTVHLPAINLVGFGIVNLCFAECYYYFYINTCVVFSSVSMVNCSCCLPRRMVVRSALRGMCAVHTAHNGITAYTLGTITGCVTPRTVRIVRTVFGAVDPISTTLAS